MKSQALLLAELRSRDLFEVAERIAKEHHVSIEDVCTPTHRRDIVRARHAIWTWQVNELQSVNAVARLWGVNWTCLRGMVCTIVYVLLAELKQADRHYRFAFFGHGKFGITDHASEVTEWFKTYDAARERWIAIEDANGQTFRAAAASSPGFAAVEGGAS